MGYNNKINKIKISLFGNIWIVKSLKLLRYIGGGFLAWMIWKSEYMFPKQTPAQVFKAYICEWNTKNVDTLLSITLQIGFIIALLFAYFWLSGKFVEWLIRIEIPASQQDKIFQNKIYSADEKTSYSVEKIDIKGDAKAGKETLQQIAREIADEHQNFRFFPQKEEQQTKENTIKSQPAANHTHNEGSTKAIILIIFLISSFILLGYFTWLFIVLEREREREREKATKKSKIKNEWINYFNQWPKNRINY